MLTVDKIPYEVKRAMRVAWAKRKNSDAPEKVMADLAVAMLNAWPRMEIHTDGTEDWIELILTQENNNGGD
jgi:hypothetical protein